MVLRIAVYVELSVVYSCAQYFKYPYMDGLKSVSIFSLHIIKNKTKKRCL